MKIGFIGLGIMGKAMAVKHDLYVMDHHQEHIDAVAAFGGHASNYAEIGAETEVVITMLPNSPQVKEVMLGEEGLGAKMHAGQVFIDCSSINPLASKEIGANAGRTRIRRRTQGN